MQKRKTLVNAIANSGKYGSKEQVEKTLQKLEIDLKIRPEKMSLEQFAKLSNLIETKIVWKLLTSSDFVV